MAAQRRVAMMQGVSGEAECFGRAVVDLTGSDHRTLPLRLLLSGPGPSRKQLAPAESPFRPVAREVRIVAQVFPPVPARPSQAG
jgi:hypothetical protein